MAATGWTIEELTGRVAALLDDSGYAGAPNGRVRDVPDVRAIRWYSSIGLVDRPLMRGRTALYGARHLLQLVAIKRRQSQGHKIAEIQAELAQAPDEVLVRIADLPPDVAARLAASAPDLSDGPPPRRFWAEPPAAYSSAALLPDAHSPDAHSPAAANAGGEAVAMDAPATEMQETSTAQLQKKKRRSTPSMPAAGAPKSGEGNIAPRPGRTGGTAAADEPAEYRHPMAATVRGNPAPDGLFTGVPLGWGAVLLLPTAPTADDVATIRRAAYELIDVLAVRGLVSLEDYETHGVETTKEERTTTDEEQGVARRSGKGTTKRRGGAELQSGTHADIDQGTNHAGATHRRGSAV